MKLRRWTQIKDPNPKSTISDTIGSNVSNILDSAPSSLTLSGSSVANNGNITFSGTGTSTVTFSAASINNSGSIINNGTTTGTTTISGVIGSAVTGITENSSTSTLILSGANTTYAGTTTLTLGTLQGLNSGITNVLQAFGTGQLNLNGGTLQLRANGSGIGVTITASNNVVVGGTTTINVDRNSTSPTANTGNTFSMGTLSIGAFTLNVTGANSYALQFGATTLTGNATFNPTTANLTLGALNDGGIARTITKAGSGTLTLGTNATSLVDGTAVGITGGILNSNAASSLGSFANVTISTGATFAIGASQTIGALNSSGTGSVTLGANALTIGNTNNLNSNFAGVISGTGGSIVRRIQAIHLWDSARKVAFTLSKLVDRARAHRRLLLVLDRHARAVQ